MQFDSFFEWKQDSECLGMDASHFFTNKGNSPTDEARAACSICPVWSECFNDALRNSSEGFRAGYTTDELRQIRVVRGIPEPPKPSLDGFLGIEPKRAAPTEIEHGTVRGRRQHQKRGVPTCMKCRKAWAEAVAEYRRTKDKGGSLVSR